MARVERPREPESFGACRFPGCGGTLTKPWAPLCAWHAAWLPRDGRPPDSESRTPLGIVKTLIFLRGEDGAPPRPGYEEACENVVEQVAAAMSGEASEFINRRSVASTFATLKRKGELR